MWASYYTSSKEVKRFREEHGEPDVIEVRQTFNDSLQAREWEIKVLKRIKVRKNEKWLNKTDRSGPSHFGIPHSDETKQKMRKSNLGKTRSEESKQNMRKHRSEEARQNMSKAHLGKTYTHTKETKQKISERNCGKLRSKETKQKISEAKKRKET